MSITTWQDVYYDGNGDTELPVLWPKQYRWDTVRPEREVNGGWPEGYSAKGKWLGGAA